MMKYESLSQNSFSLCKKYEKDESAFRGLKKEIASKELYKEVGECMDELYEDA
ncbi:MAG: hypothetical protein ACLRSW_09510 [Christensenellaceae bacterium]